MKQKPKNTDSWYFRFVPSGYGERHLISKSIALVESKFSVFGKDKVQAGRYLNLGISNDTK